MTDNELKKWNKDAEDRVIKALECCQIKKVNECAKCPYLPKISRDCERFLVADALDLITRQKAEIERLEKANLSIVGHLKKARKQLKTAKAEAIKEFWNQRPPQLNPNQDGKKLYNQGWNDCISFFAEEYKIFLGIKKRSEEMVGDV